MDYYQLYKNSEKIKKSKEYNIYLKKLKKYYYDKSECPQCHKKLNINKSSEYLIDIICKNNCKWSIKIKLAKYINLYSELFNLTKKKYNIVINIIDIIKNYKGKIQNSNILILKKKYITIDSNIKNIKKNI